MGWPERLLWALGAFGGPAIMIAGPYEIVVSLPGKVLLAAACLAIFWVAAYHRAKYLNETADTAEHHLRFFNPEVMRDVSRGDDGISRLTFVQFRVHLRNDYNRPIDYHYEVFDVSVMGFSSEIADSKGNTLGPTLVSGYRGPRVHLIPTAEPNITGRFRWLVRYGTNKRKPFVLKGAMSIKAAFDPTSGDFRVMEWNWLDYDDYGAGWAQ